MTVAHIEIDLRIQVGNKTVEIRHEVDAAGDAMYPVIRELIREAADAGARAFPNPRSPYSDDLFKAGTDKRVGVVDAPPSPPNRSEEYED
ncbi:hypothetical protein NTR1_73 [Nocardia phage NTR1]|nr:hypothetical protein NTR1_73 [Nocardia phage NTR1]